MSPGAESMLDKARRSIDEAAGMAEMGSPDFAASRAYYAMFYLAQAMLMVRGLSYSHHKNLIAGFGKEFAKVDSVWQPVHRHLIDAYERRQKGDHGDSGEVTTAEARRCIEWAREFLAMAEDWLERNDVPESDAG